MTDPTMDNSIACFWHHDKDAERLVSESVDEAVERFLDDLPPEMWPETLKVYGFAPAELPGTDSLIGFGGPLEGLLESLDEEYGDPEDYHCRTNKMEEAERVFVDTVLSEYQVWTHEPVCSQEIHVRTWVLDHRPHWLEEVEDG